MRKEIALEAIRRFAEALGINPMRIRIEKQRELGREPNPEEAKKIGAYKDKLSEVEARKLEDLKKWIYKRQTD